MGGTSATNLKSVQKSIKNLRTFLRTIETIPRSILESEAARMEREAKAQTPYKSGKLEDSVRVSVSNAKSKYKFGINMSASARSKGYNYAGIQHENTTFNHPIKGKAHYLSDPFEAGTKRIKRRLKAALKPPGGK